MVKRFTIIVVLVCAWSTNASAQNLFFGIKNGLNLSKISRTGPQQDLQEKTKDYVGYNFSGWFGYNITPNLRLAVEPGYVVKGAAIQGSTESIKLQYIDIPVLLEYQVVKGLNIQAGPSLAYLIRAERKTDAGSVDLSKLYNESSELSGILGVSFDVSFFMDIGVRYNMGFTKISETVLTNETGDPVNSIKEYNRYLQFLIRLKIAN